ncbi:DUF417 family protein [Streptomyces flaveolus]|uniref:DUF417 family protein n=1 Tax=Streptomyces flaveolus TaxID=67297 RepID=UPI003418719D
MIDAQLHRGADTLARAGRTVSRYGLAVVLAWFGTGKFVKMDSRVLIQNSPLMSWLYDIVTHESLAAALGTTEIAAAVLVALYPRWPRLSSLGSMMAIMLFLATISFLFTTPGVIATFTHGVPVLSAQPGQFLLKDLVLLGVSLTTLAESLKAVAQVHHTAQPRNAHEYV